MSEIKDGGPAFAAAAGNSTDFGVIQEGLSKREWFAGMVLPNLLKVDSILKTEIGEGDPYKTLSAMAYKFADAMIQESESGSEKVK